MYYRLKNDYKMRGWRKATSALVDSDNYVQKLDPEEFLLLLLCDGETVFNESALTKLQKDLIHDFLNRGVIERIIAPKPLNDDQKYQFYDNRLVDSVYWSITGKCNYKCRHCYVGAPNAKLGEISHEQALSFIDQMADCGVLSVDLTGGEPLVRNDFWDLVDRILAKSMQIGTIYTNGALLTGKVLEGFLQRQVKPDISLSYDGVGFHDWMRGVEGAEKAAIRALKLCKEYGFSTDVEMCLHKGNRDTIRDTVNRLSDLGVSALKVSSVSETELWQRHADGNILPIREYFETCIAYIPFFYKDGMLMDVTLGSVAVMYKGSNEYFVVPDAYTGCSDEEFDDQYLCKSARFNSYISPDGRLLPCMPMAAYAESGRFPRIQDIGIQDGFTDGKYMEFIDHRIRDLRRLNRECAECPYFRRCGGGCRANALAIEDIEGKTSVQKNESYETRLMGRDPLECILFKEGYVDRLYQTFETSLRQYCR